MDTKLKDLIAAIPACPELDKLQDYLESLPASEQKPVAYQYKVNGIWTHFTEDYPPEDAYDEGSLVSLFPHAPDSSARIEELEAEVEHLGDQVKENKILCFKLLEDKAALKEKLRVAREALQVVALPVMRSYAANSRLNDFEEALAAMGEE